MTGQRKVVHLPRAANCGKVNRQATSGGQRLVSVLSCGFLWCPL